MRTRKYIGTYNRELCPEQERRSTRRRREEGWIITNNHYFLIIISPHFPTFFRNTEQLCLISRKSKWVPFVGANCLLLIMAPRQMHGIRPSNYRPSRAASHFKLMGTMSPLALPTSPQPHHSIYYIS
jgi:hypothetical protein